MLEGTHADMKAILIDPWKKRIEPVNVRSGNEEAILKQLYDLIGEDCDALDFWILRDSPGESIVVRDHSVVYDSAPGCFQINRLDGKDVFYGRAVMLGCAKDETLCDTKHTVDGISSVIGWYPG
jgi:hypothetical protein